MDINSLDTDGKILLVKKILEEVNTSLTRLDNIKLAIRVSTINNESNRLENVLALSNSLKLEIRNKVLVLFASDTLKSNHRFTPTNYSIAIQELFTQIPVFYQLLDEVLQSTAQMENIQLPTTQKHELDELKSLSIMYFGGNSFDFTATRYYIGEL